MRYYRRLSVYLKNVGYILIEHQFFSYREQDELYMEDRTVFILKNTRQSSYKRPAGLPVEEQVFLFIGDQGFSYKRPGGILIEEPMVFL